MEKNLENLAIVEELSSEEAACIIGGDIPVLVASFIVGGGLGVAGAGIILAGGGTDTN